MAAFWSRKNKKEDKQEPAVPSEQRQEGEIPSSVPSVREHDRDVSEMKEFIEFLAKSLVDHPEEVEVRRIDGEKTVVFELRVNKSDIGKIIGRNGRTIRAIRTLLTTTAAKHGQRAVLEILE